MQNVLKQSVLSVIRVSESALYEQVIWCAGKDEWLFFCDLHYGAV